MQRIPLGAQGRTFLGKREKSKYKGRGRESTFSNNQKSSEVKEVENGTSERKMLAEAIA